MSVLRELKPIEVPQVAEWLKALGGAQHEELLDWIAAVTHLDKPCAILYLDGGPGTGKTLLANGLSRLWTEHGPVLLSEVAGSHNDYLLSCPLILADEVLPDVLRRAEGILTVSKREVRLIFTTNNHRPLDIQELPTVLGPAAVVERVLYVHISKQTRKVLESLESGFVRKFVTDDLLAKHALWLKDKREVMR